MRPEECGGGATYFGCMRIAPSTRIVSGFDASKPNVLGQDLNGVEVLHFATHGIVNDQNPGDAVRWHRCACLRCDLLLRFLL